MTLRATLLCSTSPTMATRRSGESVEAAERLAEGVEVEEGLGRVLAAAVAGVDHRSRGVAGGEGRRSRGLMPKHDRIRPEAVEGYHGVDQGLALGDGRALFGE